MVFNRYATIALMVMSLLVMTACAGGQESDGLPVITITEDGRFSPKECAERNLTGQVVMLESKYCGHCKETLPVFLEACAERGIEPRVLDLSDKEVLKRTKDAHGIMAQYTPTFLFDCEIVIGAQSKDEYLTLLGGAEDG